jgi:hypothetical protein
LLQLLESAELVATTERAIANISSNVAAFTDKTSGRLGVGLFSFHARIGRLEPTQGSMHGLNSRDNILRHKAMLVSGDKRMRYSGFLYQYGVKRFGTAGTQPPPSTPESWAQLADVLLAKEHCFPGAYIPKAPTPVTLADLAPGQLFWTQQSANAAVRLAFTNAKAALLKNISRMGKPSAHLQPLNTFHALAIHRARLLGKEARREFFPSSISFLPSVTLADFHAAVQAIPVLRIAEADERNEEQALMELGEGCFGIAGPQAGSVAGRRRLLNKLCSYELCNVAISSFASLSFDLTATEKDSAFNATATRAAMADPQTRTALLRDTAADIPPASRAGEQPSPARPALSAALLLLRRHLCYGGDVGLKCILWAAQRLREAQPSDIIRLLGDQPGVARTSPAHPRKGQKQPNQAVDPQQRTTTGRPRPAPNPDGRYNRLLCSLHRKIYLALKEVGLPSEGHGPIPPCAEVPDHLCDQFLYADLTRVLDILIATLQPYLAALGDVKLGDEFASGQYDDLATVKDVPPLVTVALAEALMCAMHVYGFRTIPPRWVPLTLACLCSGPSLPH